MTKQSHPHALLRWVLAAILIAATSSRAIADTRTWTGANSGMWSDAGNWSGGPPMAGDDLIFPAGAANRNSTNDLAPGTLFNSLTFHDGNTIGGNLIALSGGSITGGATLNVDLSLAATCTVTIPSAITFGGVVSGAGGLIVNGQGSATVTMNGANTYTGGTTFNSVQVYLGNDSAFGTGPVTLNSTINLGGHTVGNALNVQGLGYWYWGAIRGVGTWTGPVTLTGVAAVGTSSPALTFTGPISGGFELYAPWNGTYSRVVLTGDSPGFTGTLHPTNGTLIVNGTFANGGADLTNAAKNTSLTGTGTIGGPVKIAPDTHLVPGVSGPGVLGTGDLTLQPGSLYDVQLNGPVVGSGYDQTNVVGTVTLGGTLVLSFGFVPPIGTQFTIIRNDGVEPVSGTFAGLPEGVSFNASGSRFHITYAGGSGNDVVLTMESKQSVFDFDGDMRTDYSVIRPSEGKWYIAMSGGGANATFFYSAGDIDVAADYDGDGVTDRAKWSPTTGVWYLYYSSDHQVHYAAWGTTGDVALAGDVDGDLKADLVLFRPSTGVWYIKTSLGATNIFQWGVSTDQPLLGDFDRDGKMDAVIYRPSTGVWYASLSGGGASIIGWGATNDIPVAGDWDGDGQSDPAIFRPSTGEWFVNLSTGGTLVSLWGMSGDIPVSGDWNNDGKSDFAVWRPSTGVWFMQLSGGGMLVVSWGTDGDKPLGRLPGS